MTTHRLDMPDGWRLTDNDPETWTRDDGLSVYQQHPHDAAPERWLVTVMLPEGRGYRDPRDNVVELASAPIAARWLDEHVPLDHPSVVRMRNLGSSAQEQRSAEVNLAARLNLTWWRTAGEDDVAHGFRPTTPGA